MKYLLLASAMATILAAHPVGAPAQERAQGVAGDLMTRDVKLAISQGLDWLAARQNSNGSWNCKIGYKLFEDYHGEDGQDVGVTALCGMAYLGAGNIPNRGKHGRVVAKALDYVLSCVREEDGYITSNGSRMYSHAFATMFLAEACGTTPRSDLRIKLKRAVNLIVGAQNREGGWRYQPIPVDADLSVTVSTLQALRAARNTGISVPLDTIHKAAKYEDSCATRRGFTYQSVSGYGISDTRVSFALTACGIVSLYSAGQYDSPKAIDAVKVLPNWKHTLVQRKLHYYYGHYYACQAMYLTGGERWT